MTGAQLEHAQKRMQQKWYELVMAEGRGAAVAVLERMYNAYILAMEEYNRCAAAYQRERSDEAVPVECKQGAKSKAGEHTQLAS
jgi:hypothetical protein